MNSKSARSIFLDAVEAHAPDEWPEYLESVCGDDTNLRTRVEKLLRVHQRMGTFSEDVPPLTTSTTNIDESAGGVFVGAQIGPYKLREQLGEGGMGAVYVAEQTEPVKRKVALKFIKPGMASKDVASRFEAERQALAMMDHPNIAKVHDGGATDTGQPYFVMELVQGLAITDYCDEHQLSTEDRLRLFATVCRAVQHAHQKGIIHRDLKPSNIIVSEIDGTAIPKVIDFGVAKATTSPLTEETLYTHFSQMVGTPLYMSPEQTGLGVIDIDTRSDVYSLGVLLYELLSGSTPFDSESLKQVGFDEMRRIIREDDPPKPSEMVSTLGAEALSTVSTRRRSDPRKLSDSLAGELDWIVMKALEKDRNRRYESASALADDVERRLRDEPIIARPASRWYQAKKFARRNRALVASSVAVVAALAVGLGVSTTALFHAVDQRGKAEQLAGELANALEETETALEDQIVLADVLRDMQPRNFMRTTRVRNRTVYESIEEIARQIDEEGRLTGHPRIEIQVRRMIADSYFYVGEMDEFQNHLEKALALAKREFGEDQLVIAQMHQQLAYAAAYGVDRIRDPTSTLHHANEAIRVYKLLHHAVPDRVYVGKAYSLLAWPERHADAIAAAEAAVSLNGERAVYTMSDLGNAWMAMGDVSSLDRALECFNKALENYQKLDDQRNHLEANLLSKKARCHRRRNEVESARKTYKAAYDLFEPRDLRNEPAGHRFGLSLADLHFAMGQVDRAFELVDEVEANARRFKVASSLILCLDLRGWMYFQLGDFQAAETLLLEAKQLAVAEHGAMDGRFALPCFQLALMYEAMGRSEQAAMQYRELQPFTQHFVDEPQHHGLPYWVHARGILATHNNAALAAEDAALLNEADRIADDGQNHVRAWRQPNQEAAFHLVKAMIQQRRHPEELELAIKHLQEGLEKAREPGVTLQNERYYIVPTDRWQLEAKLVELLVAAERAEEAHHLMKQAVAVRTNARMLGPEHIQTILADIRLGEFRLRQGLHNERTAEDLAVAFERLRQFSNVVDGVRRRLAGLLIDVHKSLDSPAEAAKWRTELERLHERNDILKQASLASKSIVNGRASASAGLPLSDQLGGNES